MDPFHIDGHMAMGLLMAEQGNMEQAVFHLSKALEIMPDDGVVINDLAKAIAKLKEIR